MVEGLRVRFSSVIVMHDESIICTRESAEIEFG